MSLFDEVESNVRSYSRSFPATFSSAKMSCMFDEQGNRYLDFFAGAGALNYGHNNDFIVERIIKYMEKNGIIHALDMATVPKRDFIETFSEIILKPKNLNYKFMFCGPTGTNAVEAAIKIARKAKKRTSIFSFSGGFHGMSLGSLSLTSNLEKRAGAGLPLNDVVFMPFPFGFNTTFDTIGYIENVLRDSHSGIEKPAAIILETVQAEGGVVVADVIWLQRLRELCDKYDILMICDEIQTGCGRTGTYFSFERANIVPDLITISKSISGSGLPMSMVLLKPEYDVFSPGEHNGTFRGNQLAFVGATAALEYMNNINLLDSVKEKEKYITNYIRDEILSYYPVLEHRGVGLIHGIDFSNGESNDTCKNVATYCFMNSLIIERAGRNDDVLKILPPLTISTEELFEGLVIIKSAIDKFMYHTKESVLL